MEGFQEHVKKWVSLDTQLKLLNEKTKEIRNERNELTDSIIEFVEDNNLSSSTIKISDGKLKFAQNRQTAPITLGFLENCLTEIIDNDEKVAHIMNYIKDKREIKIIPDIKRYYNN
jgi:septal ring factor EnvC (AmiA/AmiB activator)